MTATAGTTTTSTGGSVRQSDAPMSVQCSSMDDRTTVLFGLDESTVVDDGAVRVMIEAQAGEGACPPGGGSLGPTPCRVVVPARGGNECLRSNPGLSRRSGPAVR